MLRAADGNMPSLPKIHNKTCIFIEKGLTKIVQGENAVTPEWRRMTGLAACGLWLRQSPTGC
jgi:hypothetical protein